MIGPTFGLYMARKFSLALAGTILSSFALITIIDFVEQLRRIQDVGKIGTSTVFLLTLYRIPSFMELLLPFATLVAAMVCFLGLSRKLELVVARASGMSAWQFLAPALIIAALVGIFAATIFNPLAAEFRDRAEFLELSIVRSANPDTENRYNFWVRQSADNEQAVIHAKASTDRGRRLSQVTIMRYDERDHFKSRIDARTAILENGYWLLIDGSEIFVDASQKKFSRMELPTRLTATQVREKFVLPEQISFWGLRDYISFAVNSGIPVDRFILQYNMLLARPLLLVAMVLIAATASLQFARLGGLATKIIGGIVAGFLLYVGSEVANNLGRSSLISPVWAAWSPALIGALMGFWLLLGQEDG